MAGEKIKMTGQQLVNAYRNEEAKLGVVQRKADSIQRILVETKMAIDSLNEIKKAKKNEKIIANGKYPIII